ncbi:TonB-dependent siderophore receptor [Methylobacterium sp. J-077]|uniref:TonB-dependent siderophore receptor n=1 Tax=Methylobacterium sp. J-077 TaxID=2836656 RepID=UPI001FBB0080|nr:TonB-dependent siderophore receptor [Methylobacterium sp. J-077]MCJ2126441.1 TonB-dependent siderophore receptor [Methylobacterium sp. J-077]
MKFYPLRPGAVLTFVLTGVSLVTMQVAQAQQATQPRRGGSNPPAESSVQLQELSVESQGGGGPVSAARATAASRAVESPTGPIDGYVARRSATATKTNTPLIETPQSITVVGRQQIDTQNAQTLTQATQYVAGTYAGTFGADTRIDYFQLRGFVVSDYGLYLNGLQLLNYGFAYSRVDTFGLERVEVLRGPSAVLFGAGNPGGLINQISKRPTEDPFGYIEVGGGSFDQRYAAFDVGGPADAEGHWFTRLTGYARNGGTQVQGAPDDSYYIAPAFTYKPDGSTKLTILSSFQHDNTAVTSNFLPYYGTVRPQAEGLRIPRSLNVGDAGFNTFQRDQAFIGYEFEHVFDDTWAVRQNARYGITESFQNSYIGQLGYADAQQTQLARYLFRDHAKVAQLDVDTQAEAKFSDGFFRHDFLMGVEYRNFQVHDNQASGFPGPNLNILAPTYGPQTVSATPYLVNADSFQQVGLYFQDQIKLTPELTLVVGGRQDFVENTVYDRLTPSNTNGRNDSAFTYRVAAIYNFDFGLAPYVMYSTSFQPEIGTDINGRAFKPDTGEQIEGGVKFEPPGQGYFLTLAGFDIHRNNVLTPNPVNTLFNTQVGEVRSTGFEAQLVANLFDGLNLIASFTDFGFTTVKDADPTRIGKTPVNIPENLASLFADYTIQVGDWRGFGFGGGVRYVGRSFADVANTLKVSEYLLFDAQVHYDYQNWRFQVNATNLADRRFVSSCQSETSCFYGDGRRVLAKVSYKW